MHDPLPGRIVTSGSFFLTSLPVFLASETLCRGPRSVVCHTERPEPCHLKNSDSETLALGMDFCTRKVSLALRLAGIAVPHRITCPALFVSVSQTWLFFSCSLFGAGFFYQNIRRFIFHQLHLYVDLEIHVLDVLGDARISKRRARVSVACNVTQRPTITGKGSCFLLALAEEL